MSDVPIVFGLAVIVDRASGDVARIFSTVYEEEEIKETLKGNERLIGIFPVCLGMGEMEKLMAHTPAAKRLNLLTSKFFGFGYRIGCEQGKKELREQVLPHLNELVRGIEMMRALEAQINDAMDSMKNPE